MSGPQTTDAALADYEEIVALLDAAIDNARNDAEHADAHDASVTAEADRERAEFLERALSFVQMAKRAAEEGEPIERRWTVVCGRPDYLNGGASHPSEEAMIVVVDAYNPSVAAGKARAKLAEECRDGENDDGWVRQLADDFAVLKVFEGDLQDRYIEVNATVEESAADDELARIAKEKTDAAA
jgi:hypothetical protein